MKILRDNGWTCGIVERWMQAARQRIELFGIIDIIACGDGATLGVQSCPYTGHAEHRRTIVDRADDTIKWLLNPNNKLLIVSWRKKKNRWVPRFEEITLDYFEADIVEEIKREQAISFWEEN